MKFDNIPFNQRFFTVYLHGFAVYDSRHLINCFRFISLELKSIPGKVTMKQAMDAGFEIKAV